MLIGLLLLNIERVPDLYTGVNFPISKWLGITDVEND